MECRVSVKITGEVTLSQEDADTIFYGLRALVDRDPLNSQAYAMMEQMSELTDRLFTLRIAMEGDGYVAS